nr:histone H3.v1-like isoform X5 [Cherax quadricarinatus]
MLSPFIRCIHLVCGAFILYVRPPRCIWDLHLVYGTSTLYMGPPPSNAASEWLTFKGPSGQYIHGLMRPFPALPHCFLDVRAFFSLFFSHRYIYRPDSLDTLRLLFLQCLPGAAWISVSQGRHLFLAKVLSETYAAFALAANASTSSSPARGRNHSLRSSTKSASSSRRPSYSSLQALRPGTRRSSQASLRLVVGEGRGEPIGYYVCIRDPASVHSRGGSRRPSQASVASSSGDLREGRVHHYLYMRAPNYSLNSETNTTTTGTSDSSPRTPKSTEQLLAVYHSVPEHTVLERGGVGSSHTTSTLGSSSDDVFKEEDEDAEEEEEEEEEEDAEQQQQQEEAKARLIV